MHKGGRGNAAASLAESKTETSIRTDFPAPQARGEDLVEFCPEPR